MDTLKVLKSNKGINDKVFFNGFEYIQDKKSKNGNKIYYSCSLYKSMKCPGRLIRNMEGEEENQYKETQSHTHVGDATVAAKAVVMRTLKRKAEETLESGRNVIAKLDENMSVAVAASLPKNKSMSQTIRRARIKKDMPPLPANLDELVLPESLSKIHDEPFLIYDSGPGPGRLLIFSTVRNLELLKRADVLSMDGTFDIVPLMFMQLYTLQGRIDGWYVPCVYIVAPNKLKKTYEEAFKVITERVPECKPLYVITDFEIGAINAGKKYFPTAKFHACFFHLCQSVWRQCQSIGLQGRYTSDPDFAKNVRQLLALAFIPPEDIPKRFVELSNTEFWTENEDPDSPKLQELLNYFELTYIGVPNRNKKTRKTVQFPPELWSVHEITILGIPRTNNSMEGWHGVIGRTIGVSHPNIFKFIEALQTEQKYQEIRIAKIDSGHSPENTPKKYRDMNDRLICIAKTYSSSGEFDCINYLNKLAFNITF